MTNSPKSNPPPGPEMTTQGISAPVSLMAAAKKALNPFAMNDRSVFNALAAVHVDQFRVLNRVGRFVKDEPGMEDPNQECGATLFPKEEAKPSCTIQRSIINPINSGATDDSCSGPGFISPVMTEKAPPDVLLNKRPHQPIFLHNLAKPFFRTPLPKPGSRFSSTHQLAFANRLVLKTQSTLIPSSFSLDTLSDNEQDVVLDETEQAWLMAMEDDTLEQSRVRTLATHIATEFLNTPRNDSIAVAEVVLLGPVLDRGVLDGMTLLDIDLLQGLVQFIHDASPGYLIDDDLVKILRVLRQRLKGTFKVLGDDGTPASDHVYRLTDAVSRMLDAMMEGNIKSLHRTEDHKPLLDILVELKSSSDPYLKFQVAYAWQALQYVGDDESPLHATLRFGGGLLNAALGVASVFKFDPDNLCNGLHELGLATGQAYDVVKAGLEGAQAFRDGGHGAVDSLLRGFRSGAKRAWYPALQGARVFIRNGRLGDFERIVYEAPCRREREFQHGVCQLLGEIAMDPIWAFEIRKRAVDFLVELLNGDEGWSSNAGVEKSILSILRHVSERAEQNIQDHTTTLLQDSLTKGVGELPRLYPLLVRLPLPKASPLLVKARKTTDLEDKVQQMISRRWSKYQHGFYVPPQGKAVLQELKRSEVKLPIKYDDETDDGSTGKVGDQSFSLMDKIMEFLGSERQVFLVLGDSGAGKSTFIRHLERELLGSYKQGERIPLFINLPASENPATELVQGCLKMHHFSEDDILDLKQDRLFTIICDGYDESQLSINLHTTNSFNISQQWDVKMIVSCRNTYLSKGYQERFEPQPIDRYRPATPNLLQEAVIIPFSSLQIVDYVEQFVRDTEVHKLFGSRPIWSAREYVDKLKRVPKLMSLVKNPFLLGLALRSLPTIVDGVLDLEEIEITRVKLYDVFIEEWLDNNRRRLRSINLNIEAAAALEDLIDGGFTKIAIKFLKDLALAIFKEQDGSPIVRYVHRDDKTTWKVHFFGKDPEVRLLRDASPLTRTGDLNRFIHRSFLEYFYDFIEQNVHRLSIIRLQEFKRSFKDIFIPCVAKSTPLSPDSSSFMLMDKVRQFLASDDQVFLLLGDSGAGKSMFMRHLERELWGGYQRGGRIPLFISLSAIAHPEKDMVDKQLLLYNFEEDQIQEMMTSRQFVFLCDGYDECQLLTNLYTSNLFNFQGHWSGKMIISCRNTHLGQDYQSQFQPKVADRYTPTAAYLFQEAFIVPFSTQQIRAFVQKYAHNEESHKLFHGGEVWDAEEYMDKLQRTPEMMRQAKNPLMLSLVLSILPSLFKDDSSMVHIKATRLLVWDTFVNQWIHVRKYGSRNIAIDPAVQARKKEQPDGGFTRAVYNFLKDLAVHIFRSNDGNPTVHYTAEDAGTWKDKFFGSDDSTRILRESSPLSQSGNRHQFIYRSLLEFFYYRAILEDPNLTESADPQSVRSPLQSADPSLSLLAERSLVNEPSILRFLVQGVQQDGLLKPRLIRALEWSKSDLGSAVAGANAITILVQAGERFSGMDLSGIRIPGANVSEGDFDSAKLVGANLSGVNLTKAWLRHADFAGAQMNDVQFGEWPYLQLKSEVNTCAYSPDGRSFAVGFIGGAVSLFRTDSWVQVRDLPGHDFTVTSLAFSPDSRQLASASEDKLIKLWDVKMGTLEKEIGDHLEATICVVYSPKEQNQIAAAKHDCTVRVYDLTTFNQVLELKGHTGAAKSVAFSPTGAFIATASYDWTVRLWNAMTGVQQHNMRGHEAWVFSVSISPINNIVASSGQDMTVRLWGGLTGMALYILRGHTAFVKTVSFSPSGHQLASGSGDHTVRLWNGLTGTPSLILSGHTASVSALAYSPDGKQIATGSWDTTVRLWGTRISMVQEDQNSYIGSVEAVTLSSAVTPEMRDDSDISSSDHTFRFSSVACSSNGQLVATCSTNLVRIYYINTGVFFTDLDGHKDSVTSMAFSPDSRFLVSGSYDKTARIWSVQTGEGGHTLSGHTEAVTAVAFSPSGVHIATGSDDRLILLWSSRTGKVAYILSGHIDVIKSLVYSPDLKHIRLASGSGDHTIKLWHARDGLWDQTLNGHSGSVESVSFSSNGKQLASGGRDGTVRIWDLSTSNTIHELVGHINAVVAVAFSPNNLRVATGSWDMTVKIWDVETGKCLVIVTEFVAEVTSIAWKPLLPEDNGSMYFVTGCNDRSVRTWKLVESGDGTCKVQLHWRSLFDGLMLSSANIQGAVGLSRANERLMQQRGAVGEPSWC
ncbi:hypothetical protein BGX24_011644 [Mortierella sp. AD032]|nr:hypothetical protein BGX24_011644 [Mortierella sp. AD032]